jgi:hypothetical protein
MTLSESGLLDGKFESKFEDNITITATDQSGASVSTSFNAKISKKSSGGSTSLILMVMMGFIAVVRKFVPQNNRFAGQ